MATSTLAQRYSDSQLTGSTRTDSSGSITFPASAIREESAVAVKCTGGSATFVLSGGAVEGGMVGAIATSGATSTSWAYHTMVPWGELTLSWTSNTGTVAVSFVSWED
jgi:hypothetical protein